MKKAKDLMQSLGAALVSIALLTLPFVIPAEAEPDEWSRPSSGAGRIVMETPAEGAYTAETETPENEPYIASQTMPETEAVSASYRQVTGKLDIIPEAEPVIETDIDALIVEAAERYGLPWQLVSAVCWAESTYNPYAVSSTPDYGLMQITESVLDAYGLTNWSDPAQNLDVGCRILREKMDLSDGDITKALTRYRFGDAEALAMWSRGEWSNWYSERVLGKYYELLRGEH